MAREEANVERLLRYCTCAAIFLCFAFKFLYKLFSFEVAARWDAQFAPKN
jgi:hypothetical protein